MSRVEIFEYDEFGNVILSKTIEETWYFQAMVDKFGKQSALKLFKIFDKYYDYSPQTNIFANVPKDTRYETILRAMYPELEAMIDLDDDIIEQALDLVGECVATPAFRAHEAIRDLFDRIITKIKFSNVSLDKEDGNMSEINKALDAFPELNRLLSSTHEELEKEKEITKYRGGRISVDRRQGGKQKDLS